MSYHKEDIGICTHIVDQYYKPNDIEKVDFMQDVFKMNSLKLKKISTPF